MEDKDTPGGREEAAGQNGGAAAEKGDCGGKVTLETETAQIVTFHPCTKKWFFLIKILLCWDVSGQTPFRVIY